MIVWLRPSTHRDIVRKICVTQTLYWFLHSCWTKNLNLLFLKHEKERKSEFSELAVFKFLFVWENLWTFNQECFYLIFSNRIIKISTWSIWNKNYRFTKHCTDEWNSSMKINNFNDMLIVWLDPITKKHIKFRNSHTSIEQYSSFIVCK